MQRIWRTFAIIFLLLITAGVVEASTSLPQLGKSARPETRWLKASTGKSLTSPPPTAPNGGRVKLASTTYLSSIRLDILSSNVVLTGEGYQSELFFQAAGGTLHTGININSVSHVEISNLRVTGSTSTPTLSRGIYIISSNDVRVHNVWESGAIYNPPDSNLIAGIGTAQSSDIWVTDCDISGNGFVASGSDVYNSSFDLLNYAPTAERIHFLRNRIHDSSTAFSIVAFDVTDSEISGNYVNQNNKLGTNHTSSGYGIASYGAAGTVTNVRVNDNTIINTAGFGLYLATVVRAVVHGNILQDVAQQQSGGSLPLSGMALNDVTYASVVGGAIIDSDQQGIWISGGGFNSVTDVSIRTSAGDCIRVAGTPPPTDIILSNNKLDRCGGVGIYVPVVSPIVRFAIHHNDIYSSVSYGIVLNAASKGTVDHNVIDAAGNDGILILDAVNSMYVTIDYNVVNGISANHKGVAIYGLNHQINNNTTICSSTTGTRGVSLDGPATASNVTENFATGCAVGVYATNGLRNQILNNYLPGNTLYYNASATSTFSGNRVSTGVTQGTAVLIAGTVTVSTDEVTDNNINIYKIAAGGTARICSVANVVAGVGGHFDILCSANDDTGTYGWKINH
jgi:hypothetical protein